MLVVVRLYNFPLKSSIAGAILEFFDCHSIQPGPSFFYKLVFVWLGPNPWGMYLSTPSNWPMCSTSALRKIVALTATDCQQQPVHIRHRRLLMKLPQSLYLYCSSSRFETMATRVSICKTGSAGLPQAHLAPAKHVTNPQASGDVTVGKYMKRLAQKVALLFIKTTKTSLRGNLRAQGLRTDSPGVHLPCLGYTALVSSTMGQRAQHKLTSPWQCHAGLH